MLIGVALLCGGYRDDYFDLSNFRVRGAYAGWDYILAVSCDYLPHQSIHLGCVRSIAFQEFPIPQS